mgnify:CR=1 FL=1
MIWVLFAAIIGTDNQEFFDMVEERQNKGAEWHLVEKEVQSGQLTFPKNIKTYIFEIETVKQ